MNIRQARAIWVDARWLQNSDPVEYFLAKANYLIAIRELELNLKRRPRERLFALGTKSARGIA